VEGYGSRFIETTFGVPVSALHYWDRIGLARASLRPAAGRGSRRMYSFPDLVRIIVIARLREMGVSVQRIRKCVEFLSKHFRELEAPLAEVSLLTDGESVFMLTADLARAADVTHGQFVWSVPISAWLRSTREAIDQATAKRRDTLVVDGRPFTGERACVPGLQYQPEERCFWTRHCRAIWRFYQEHPEGPYTYGWWDSCPGRPQARDIWLDYFDLYRPMVENGGRAWLEVRDGSLFAGPVPEHVTASLFVNTETYLVLANYGQTAETVVSSWNWEDRRTGQGGTQWTVPPRNLVFLRRAAEG